MLLRHSRSPELHPVNSPHQQGAQHLVFGGKKRKEPLFLTELQEQDIAEWYRNNEVLYNKVKKEYKEQNMDQIDENHCQQDNQEEIRWWG